LLHPAVFCAHALLIHNVPVSQQEHKQRKKVLATGKEGLNRKVMRALNNGAAIINTTKITVHPEKRTELFQTIGRLLKPIQGATGCRTIRFYLDSTDENSLLLMSEWQSESDLNNYLHSNDFAILRGAIRVLSVSSTESRARVTSQARRS
jgi:quinol monooxygenase YgiN